LSAVKRVIELFDTEWRDAAAHSVIKPTFSDTSRTKPLDVKPRWHGEPLCRINVGPQQMVHCRRIFLMIEKFCEIGKDFVTYHG
jgi:hypothetical protein